MAGPDWDARSCDRISSPHAAMGAPALDRLALAGHERVLDAGCGSGRLAERLAGRLPDGRVAALDGSAAMLAEARRRLARFGDRVSYVQADLATPPLPVEDPVGATLSTATFHRVPDQDAPSRGLADVLRPGGLLSVQCGGAGNVEELIAAVRAEGVGTADRFHFAGPAAIVGRLTGLGFGDLEAWLTTGSIAFGSPEDLEEYIVTPCLRPATGLPEVARARLARAPLARAAAARLSAPMLHYVRLNITARMR
jgi:trans-aconitate 2-methyltransferase